MKKQTAAVVCALGRSLMATGALLGFFYPQSFGKTSNGVPPCADDTWTPISTTSAPTARFLHTAEWTGNEMIVWSDMTHSHVNTGGRYDPSTDSWTPTSTANAPDGREEHTAVWTGSEMIVWGGADNNGTDLNTGARYNPSTDNI